VVIGGRAAQPSAPLHASSGPGLSDDQSPHAELPPTGGEQAAAVEPAATTSEDASCVEVAPAVGEHGGSDEVAVVEQEPQPVEVAPDAGEDTALAERPAPRGASRRSWLRARDEDSEAPDVEAGLALDLSSSRGRHRLSHRSVPADPGVAGPDALTEPDVDNEPVPAEAPSRYAVLNQARMVWTADGEDLL
jgi:hypothetical protein